MAYTSIGADVAVNYYDTRGWTLIQRVCVGGGSGAIVSRGILKIAGIRVTGTFGGKFKIFRDDGTNWLYIGGDSAFRVYAAGYNEYPVFTPGVEVGDYLGISFDPAAPASAMYGIVAGSGAGDTHWKTGDITTNTAKSSWTQNNTWRISLTGKIFTRVAPL